MTTPAPHAIGAAIPRVEARQKVTGAGRYAQDIPQEGALWAKALRSPYPHARIRSIDASAALALPGVHAVITGDDIPANSLWGRRTIDIPVLAQGIVRFAGEQVAAVVADDEEIAARAAALIEVDYEVLPALTDPEAALAPGAALVHPEITSIQGLVKPLEAPTNAVCTFEWGQGDVEEGFAEAVRVVEGTYTTPVVHQGYMEPHSQVCAIDAEGILHIWAPCKAPYSARAQTAKAVGIDEDRIVVHPVLIGGDFGGKGSAMNMPLGYYATRAVGGRPVRMVFDYAEELMAANPRHSSLIRLRTGLRADGSPVALHADIIFNSGAYAGFKPAGHLGGAAAAAGVYRIPNVRVVEQMVYTNTVPCGHMRGPGEPQALFALESHMDEVARAAGEDPAAYRLRHLARDGEPIGTGHAFVENRGVETLEAALNASGYDVGRRPAEGSLAYGRGVAIGERTPGSGRANARVVLAADGSVTLHTPLFDQGSGAVTVVAQVVAEDLGISVDEITVVNDATGTFDDDSGIGGSRVTNVGSMAAHAAVANVHAEVAKLAAELEGWPEEHLSVRGRSVVRADTGASMPWAGLLARTGGSVSGEQFVSTGREASPVTGYCAQVAQVSVDTETGQVRLLRLTSAHDTGVIVNPIGHQGQVNGGAMFGVGYGLLEEVKQEDGLVTTLSFADWKMLSMADVPEFNPVILERPGQGVGPHNIKAIGESPNAPTAAAIANAVYDAVGVRITSLPVTAEKVYAALQAKG
jgi:CO/xanthine dehydrogenase Mo-binding subunit